MREGRLTRSRVTPTKATNLNLVGVSIFCVDFYFIVITMFCSSVFLLHLVCVILFVLLFVSNKHYS